MADPDKAALEKAREIIAKGCGCDRDCERHGSGNCGCEDDAATIITYLQTTPTVLGSRGRTAEGVETVVVPVEPTSKMLQALWETMFQEAYDCTADPMLHAGYRAMTSPEALEE